MGRSRRVLVVDPDSEWRRRIVSAVASLDETVVETAADGDLNDELDGAASHTCVVTRHAGENADGLAVLAGLQDSHESVPVVVILDAATTTSATSLLDAGAWEVVDETDGWERLLERRVERALAVTDRESELETYETIVETMQEGAFVLDEAGRRVFVDERTAEVFDWSETALLDATAEQYAEEGIIDEGALTHYQQRRDQVLDGTSDSEQVEVEMDLPTTDGPITTETRLTRITRNGSDGAAVGITRDISARKELERQLRESQVPTTTVVGLRQRWATRLGNLIDRHLPLCRRMVGRAWSNYSRSSVRSFGPPDGRPNPRGVRVSRGHGQNSVHRYGEGAQPPAVRWPRGTGIHAGLRMARRTGRALAP